MIATKTKTVLAKKVYCIELKIVTKENYFQNFGSVANFVVHIIHRFFKLSDFTDVNKITLCMSRKSSSLLPWRERDPNQSMDFTILKYLVF